MRPLRIIIAALLVSLNAGCNLCGNQEVFRVPSPDGKIEAVMFERDCGATTDFSTQISMVGKGGSVQSGVGNAFIADSNHGAAPVAKWGGPAVDIKWAANRQLVISIHPATRISVQESTVPVRTGLLTHEQVAIQYSRTLQ
jgi:hypothetical protein